MFTKDELFNLEYAVANLIQDKQDYCATEDDNEQTIQNLEELQAKVQGYLRIIPVYLPALGAAIEGAIPRLSPRHGCTSSRTSKKFS